MVTGKEFHRPSESASQACACRRMKKAAASEPGGIDEVGGIDDQRVALPFTDRKPVVIAFDRFGALAAVGRMSRNSVLPPP